VTEQSLDLTPTSDNENQRCQ